MQSRTSCRTKQNKKLPFDESQTFIDSIPSEGNGVFLSLCPLAGRHGDKRVADSVKVVLSAGGAGLEDQSVSNNKITICKCFFQLPGAVSKIFIATTLRVAMMVVEGIACQTRRITFIQCNSMQLYERYRL